MLNSLSIPSLGISAGTLCACALFAVSSEFTRYRECVCVCAHSTYCSFSSKEEVEEGGRELGY